MMKRESWEPGVLLPASRALARVEEEYPNKNIAVRVIRRLADT